MRICINSRGGVSFSDSYEDLDLELGIDGVAEIELGEIVEDEDADPPLTYRYTRVVQIKSRWKTLSLEMGANDRTALQFHEPSESASET